MAQQKKRSGKNQQKSGLALALWALAALILLVIFVVNQKKIISNLKSTDFFDQVFGKTPAFVENSETEEIVDQEIDKNDVQPESSVVSISVNPTQTTSSVTAQNEAAREQEAQATEAKNVQQETQPVSAPQTISQTPQPSTIGQTMNVRLFFMEIESDGSVARHEVTRTMKKSDSPLVDTLNALIAGPTDSEEDDGCRSLISSGTKLLGASVKNGVATLNFSSEFEFNQYGVEGTRGQLQQIVYTATAFPTVESVQFLIDGEKREYLGSEGVWVGTPLNRRSF
ncbi:MAG: GerMN domain-containing protein [Treponema sp.]|nr:GerMN domain-containing protein [Treponema sp.]